MKAEPPDGDPLQKFFPNVYADLHNGIHTYAVDLKTLEGRQFFNEKLNHVDILLTSFRPSALQKLGLSWDSIHKQHPSLSQIAIVGDVNNPEDPGHDLNYLARNGLVSGKQIPSTLYADMAGSLFASEAILSVALTIKRQQQQTTGGSYIEVALSDAAYYLGLPNIWGITRPGGILGGAHAGYNIYSCRDGRVAVAALEPQFAIKLCQLVGISKLNDNLDRLLLAPETHSIIENFMNSKTCAEVETLARDWDLPLTTMKDH
jgi:crotonobetainyl-CoA:carnitine CoA-transferase CaiB-like acyl-CoA transferase